MEVLFLQEKLIQNDETELKRNRLYLGKTCKTKDSPTRKQPKHVPAAET